ncbi:hypothetical protein ACSC95_19155 [Burkholderia vietnamiensis]
MTIFTFANNVNTTLAGAITPSSTSLTLSSAAGLPNSIPVGQALAITLNDVATRQNFEVIYATSISGATLTGLQRGREGTAALAWSTGDFAYSPPTRGQQQNFGQLPADNDWTGVNTFSNPPNIPNASATNQPVALGQMFACSGAGNSSSSGNFIQASSSFVAPQNCFVYVNGSGGNENPISGVNLAASNTTTVFEGINFSTATGGSNNIAIANGIFKAASGAPVTITLSMSYVASALQNVSFIYFIVPTP